MAATDVIEERRRATWNGLKVHSSQCFHGLWTVWHVIPGEPPKADPHRSKRNFHEENEDIVHTNTHVYDNGTEEVRGPWRLTFKDNSLVDGLMHPFFPIARGLFFSNGDMAWITREYEDQKRFMAELFFCHKPIRRSMGVTYGPDGEVSRIFLIREDTRGWPSPEWSSDLTVVPVSEGVPDDWPVAGPQLPLMGRELVVTSELEQYDGDIVEWKPPGKVKDGYCAHALPDKNMVVYPSPLPPAGTEFEITGLCYTTLEGPPSIRQMTLYFDKNGKFTMMKELNAITQVPVNN